MDVRINKSAFLSNLFISHGSWEQAIKHYHSSDPKKNVKYHEKVLAAWSGSKNKEYSDSSLENLLVKANLLLPIPKPDLDDLNKKIQFESQKTKLNSTHLSKDFELIKDIHELLKPLKANNATKGGLAADIGPLHDEGVPVMSLKVNSSKYFWYHHSPADTFDKVDFIEFNSCVASMAIMAFTLADLEETLSR